MHLRPCSWTGRLSQHAVAIVYDCAIKRECSFSRLIAQENTLRETTVIDYQVMTMVLSDDRPSLALIDVSAFTVS